MDEKDPFGYPLFTYVWVIGLGLVGGLLRYLTTMERFNIIRLITEILSSGFIGLITFWMCEYQDLGKLMTAILVAIAGHLGGKVWDEFLNFFRLKFGGTTAPPPTGTGGHGG